MQYVSPKVDLAHQPNLALSNSFSKFLVLDENLFKDKHENVNIVDYNPSLVFPVVAIPGTNNNSSKLVASNEKFLHGTCM